MRHGAASRGKKTPEYAAWQSMRWRCKTTKGPDVTSYRDRGITICERWGVFENFLSDMGLRPSPAHSLDREHNDKGYSPENCRWATPEQQVCNRRASLIWHIRGETFESLRQAGAHFRVDPKTIHYWARTGKEGYYVARKY